MFPFQSWTRIIKSLPWLLGLLGFFLMPFAACRQQTENPSRPPEKITIAYSTAPHAALFHVAFTKGFFSAEGLEVTAQPHEFGKQALDSLLEGKADLATVADTPIMFAVTRGKRICLLAVLAMSNKATAIVARRDRGITTPADLKGEKDRDGPGHHRRVLPGFLSFHPGEWNGRKSRSWTLSLMRCRRPYQWEKLRPLLPGIPP